MCIFTEKAMIRYRSEKQLSIEEFQTPFQMNLKSSNRWVKLSQKIPWDDLAIIYYKVMSADQGAPSIDARRIIGSLIIKHKLNLTDEETVSQIQENPYLQFFLGYSVYESEPIFSPTLFVEIRKRLGIDKFNEMSSRLIDKAFPESETNKSPKPRKRKNQNKTENQKDLDSSIKKKKSQKTLIIDATVAEHAIKYPNDLDLLNDSRKACEEIIDRLYPQSDLQIKPRTYRREAKKQYLSTAKKKNKSRKELRKAIGKQLRYIRRDIKIIEKLLDKLNQQGFPLPMKYQRRYWIVQEIYRQQNSMYKSKIRRCDDRIVSISQPHIRPIVRGKAGKKVEFGPKLGVGMQEGFALVDNFSWDAYNESTDLVEQIENYRKRAGSYPDRVIADQLYGTIENRNFMKSNGIRFAGKALGRPKTATEENRIELKKDKERRKKEYRERIPIEGKFGQGKNGYRLNYIRARLTKTSESWIGAIFFVMNLMNLQAKKINSTLNIVKNQFLKLKIEIIFRDNYYYSPGNIHRTYPA